MRLIMDDKDDRYFFTATFIRYAISSGKRGISERLIFGDIRDINGIKIADHAEFSSLLTFKKLNLKYGDRVSFYARIVYFRKEFPNFRYNSKYEIYPRLLNPTKAKKLICPVKEILYDNINDNTYCKIKINPTK